METINETFLYNQSLLTGLFHNQIMSLQQTQQILKNCVDLNLLSKKVFFHLLKGHYKFYVWKSNNYRHQRLDIKVQIRRFESFQFKV